MPVCPRGLLVEPQLVVWRSIAIGLVPPIDSMPTPYLPASSDPDGDRAAATANSIVGRV